ncbi:unnamed protein product [Arctia plantaginis]|uniref:Uncharacterized protein n=1 Tax=Arctia plantaginis TaxID=874455 RepID=A0A8S1A5I5_ARCPL|nr:unnamed protein product [Arctia plantaginis]
MKEHVHETTGQIGWSTTIDYSRIPKVFHKRYWSTTMHNARAGVRNSIEKNTPKIDNAKKNVRKSFRIICKPGRKCVINARRSSRWAAQYAGNSCRYVRKTWMNTGRYLSRTSSDAGRYVGNTTYGAGRYMGRSSMRAGRYLGRASRATGRFLRKSSCTAGSYLSRGSRSLYQTLRSFSIRSGRYVSNKVSSASFIAMARAREASYVSGPYYARKFKSDCRTKINNSRVARTLNDMIENSRIPKACHDRNCDCDMCPTHEL